LNQYQPDRGDFVYLDFDPQAGREQAGRRPALVLSPRKYNAAVGLMIVCPITNQIKGRAFDVEIPTGYKISGAILTDHLKSVDWKARKATFVSTAPKEVMNEVLARLEALLFDS
jgi:mRNA interferase MazF